MTSPHDIGWLPESKVTKVCGLPRSTLRSWKASGLSLAVSPAYDLKAVVVLVVLATTRDFLSPKEMVAAWRALAKKGLDDQVVSAARRLEKQDRFDVVIDLKYESLQFVQSDSQLRDAVRQSDDPRPMVVVDVAGSVFRAVEYFNTHANRTAPPTRKKPGRPASAERKVVQLRAEDGG